MTEDVGVKGATTAQSNGTSHSGEYVSGGDPVCLIHGGPDGLRVAEEGIRLLETLHEPIAVVCLAGQYRTGKSFFLNQLAHSSQRSPATKRAGFRVGPTTESCTRGIWLWDPQPPVRNARGDRVLFMDTEGIAATDNDESYDAKIFSLGLLLSSLFVFNTMGVIDEGAIDRLYLVSELTKHVCISADTQENKETPASRKPDDDEDGGGDWKDSLAESRELAPHFPPFIWLLRDFLLDMQTADGRPLTANEYLEKSLDVRDGSSRRNEERNRIRTSIRILFARRECLTLVRPVMDESQLRHAADLVDDKLRPEFMTQMQLIRDRILSIVTPKQMFGKAMDGQKLAHLVRCYTATMSNGSVPDIKAAWAYVSEATCQTAMLAAMELYEARMNATQIRLDEEEDETKRTQINTTGPIISQQEFEQIHRDAHDEALNLFKHQSVEGNTRTTCFQKLKTHIQKHKTALIAALQKRSTALCEHVLSELKRDLLLQPMAAGKWDYAFFEAASREGMPSLSVFQATLNEIESKYEEQAQGPAKKATLFNFLRNDALAFFEALFSRLSSRHVQFHKEWEERQKALDHTLREMQRDHEQQLQTKTMEIRMVEEAKTHVEEKERTQIARNQELKKQCEQHVATIASLEEKRCQQKTQHEELQSKLVNLEREVDRAAMQVTHTSEKLQQREDELKETKKSWHEQTEALRHSHQQEKEEWIQKLSDQTAERMTLQKTLRIRDHELQQKDRSLEMTKKESQQLTQQLDQARLACSKLETDSAHFQDLQLQAETRLEASIARQRQLQDELGRERSRMDQRMERFQTQLGRVESDREVEAVLHDCVTEVVRLAEVEKARVLMEERNVLLERLGEIYLKISTLPEFYQREIFCSPDPTPSFFDILTQ
ncbi:hypothetical protein Poli38472_011375 [Pythium oligandrum]|uniref:GB1/RHD3-type G domain-containing protein n=1 Tax=Pythium oligandrum TaxID=41045 RepID=A0A8K1CJN6_PYTOL|nr:hypothetical protein Poli38472_011375 [Pythium oligandrum]|eukprot:TMW64495.1 hypothetical protein Poli38472_011375 [Pythium oligandrum]